MRTLPLALVAVLVSPLIGVATAESATTPVPARSKADVLTLNLRAGDTVDFSWSATTSVEFTVEQRATGNDLVQQISPSAQGTFTAPADGTYLFSFRNETASPATVTWSIAKREPGLLILAVLVGVLILLLIAGLWQRRRHAAWRVPAPPITPLR